MSNPFVTMWRLLISPFVAVVWMVLLFLLYLGWGMEIADKFIRAWNSMYNEPDDDGPITGGPLPPDPVESNTASRQRGQDIG